MTAKRLTLIAALPLIAVLATEVWPFIRAFGVTKDWPQYVKMVGHIGSPLSVVTMAGMLVVLRWSKTIVATMSAMIGVAVGVDMARYGVDFSKPYAIQDLFWTASFGLAAILLILALLVERRHQKAVPAQ